MPNITLTLSVPQMNRVVDALSASYGYQELLPDGSANPETRGEFARQQLMRWLRQEVTEHELRVARAAVSVPPVDVT